MGDVVSMNHSNTVMDAVRVMYDKRIGCVVIGQRHREGSVKDNLAIFSERDFVSKAMLRHEYHHMAMKLFDVETPPQELITVRPFHSIHMCLRLMVRMGIRHLPVIDNEECVCILSLRSILL